MDESTPLLSLSSESRLTVSSQWRHGQSLSMSSFVDVAAEDHADEESPSTLVPAGRNRRGIIAPGKITFALHPRLGIHCKLSAVAVNIALSVLLIVTQYPLVGSWQVQKYFALLGAANTVNGLLVAASSSEDRTPVFLQPVLQTALIPFTVLMSYLLLGKREGSARLIACLAVVVGVIVSAEPVMFNIDGLGRGVADARPGHTSSLVHVAWSCVYLLGYLPIALAVVVQEKLLKMKEWRKPHANGSTAWCKAKRVKTIQLLFWANLWTCGLYAVMFWADFIPGFGTVSTLSQFKNHIDDGFRCMMGVPRGPGAMYNESGNCQQAGDLPNAAELNPDPHCSLPAYYGWVFTCSLIGCTMSAPLLIKYSSGAVYLVVVEALVTPLGAIFWFLFQLDPRARVHWKPTYHRHGSMFTLAGLLVVMLAVVCYEVIGHRQTKQAGTLSPVHTGSTDL
ncbi:uncharacterized protein LOC135813609 isoform X2 [Sycon ciliatum]|uniref:uncharacterized protein LOC135813609 isoform X2 n=1 Tax=Sycon ciliatum TaxID=27933 RepID=UPI0031F6EBE4